MSVRPVLTDRLERSGARARGTSSPADAAAGAGRGAVRAGRDRRRGRSGALRGCGALALAAIAGLVGLAGLAASARPAHALAGGWPKNGLSVAAFRKNALTTNAAVLDGVAAGRLPAWIDVQVAPAGGRVFSPKGELAAILAHPSAQPIAEEIVRCALDPGDVVRVGPREWAGELGLCTGAGGWDAAGSRPTPRCQQRVTACVMARVNAVALSVPISIRGAPEVYPLRDRIVVDTALRSGDGDPVRGAAIPDFAAGWRPAYVGTCARGRTVTVTSPQGAALRVCAGLHGCGAAGVGPPLPYSRHLAEAAAAGASTMITFPCPAAASGVGTFSVMIAGDPGTATADAARYPAPERELFAFVEGAFYGDLFDPRGLAVTCETGPAQQSELRCQPTRRVPKRAPPPESELPYASVFACYDSPSGLGVAYLNSRICTSPGGGCFPNPPRACHEVCTRDAASGAWTECGPPAPSTGARYPALTTFLNEPCDLIDRDGALCSRLRAASAQPPKRPGGCCRGGQSGGAAQLTGSTALVGLIALRRRRRRAR
jgi:hypothetical protein